MGPLFKNFKRPQLFLRFLLYSISSLLLMACFTSNAMAIPVRVLDVTITYYDTPPWVHNLGFGIHLFESPSNTWGTPQMWQDTTTLTSMGGALSPGVTVYEVSLPFIDLTNVYMSMSGGFGGSPEEWGDPRTSIFVAEPPTGWVSDDLVWTIYGPPWIPLANLDSGALSGDLWIINGYDSQAGTSHPWVVGTWEATVVPEPSSLLLMGAGLTGLVLGTWRRRRQS